MDDGPTSIEDAGQAVAKERGDRAVDVQFFQAGGAAIVVVDDEGVFEREDRGVDRRIFQRFFSVELKFSIFF